MKTDLFRSCGHCWISQICWHTECITLTASSLRIWSSSTGIQSPPLALFVVMLAKVNLTSHFRMSGSRWVITPLWVMRSFLYSSSVYSCHLFLISSASIRSMPFLSFIVSIFAWNVPLVSLSLILSPWLMTHNPNSLGNSLSPFWLVHTAIWILEAEWWWVWVTRESHGTHFSYSFIAIPNYALSFLV